MTSGSRKRASPSETDSPIDKRRRIASPQPVMNGDEAEMAQARSSTVPTADELAKNGLKRGIALALSHVGFEAASLEALESFTAMTDTYLTSFLEDVRGFSNAARRSQPIPLDYDIVLKRFNLPISTLQPHLKPPIPRRKRITRLVTLPLDEPSKLVMPYLGEELSGRPEKEAKTYIPKSFPDFPSIHTYKNTPQFIESITVPGDSLNALNAAPDHPMAPSFTASTPQTATNGTTTPLAPKPRQQPLLPHEIPRGDPKKLREAAAKEAKLGEEALRRLMRASKIAKQKEVWAVAQRDPERKSRMELWDRAMRELLNEDRGVTPSRGPGNGTDASVEIADHSMVVNAEMRFQRQEGVRGKTGLGNV